MQVISPDGHVYGEDGRVRLDPLPPGKGLMRKEIHRLLKARGWSWRELASQAGKADGKDYVKAFYLIRSGRRSPTPGMVRTIVAAFGHLTPDQVRRLHVAGALDAGFRIGG